MKLRKMLLFILTVALLASCQSKEKKCKKNIYDFQVCVDEDWYYNHGSYGDVYTKGDVFVVFESYTGDIKDEEKLFHSVKTSLNFWDLNRYKNYLKIKEATKKVDGDLTIYNAVIEKDDKEYVKIISKTNGEIVSFVAIASKNLDDIEKTKKDILKSGNLINRGLSSLHNILCRIHIFKLTYPKLICGI